MKRGFLLGMNIKMGKYCLQNNPNYRHDIKKPKSLKQFFCKHIWIEKSRGIHSWQKGDRETLFFDGKVMKCVKCKKEKFVFESLLPKGMRFLEE